MSSVSCLPSMTTCETRKKDRFSCSVEYGWETIERFKIKIPRRLDYIYEIKQIESTIKDTVPIFTCQTYVWIGVLCHHNILYEDKKGRLMQYEKPIVFCERVQHNERSGSVPEAIACIGEQNYRLCSKRKIELSLFVEIVLW